ncbi:AsmA-like C-terminal region-containing protein [Marimonas sp. MJW-29]|uniref:AsmA-like C-terminal region-containing protein n=1 Tax=Sulfitobacter sediminis TaxID=3234186 RepID=A0ABV3RJ54_9RHOB
MSKAPAEKPKISRRKKHGRALGKGVAWMLNAALALTTVTVLFVGGTVFYLKRYPLTAPDWAQEMISRRLAEVMPESRVDFGDMSFVMDENWRPRIQLRNVALSAADGAEIARFNAVEALFAAKPLLDGQIQPREIALSGIFAKLSRAADGSVALQAGIGGVAPQRQAATLPQLIGQVDELLETPALRSLRNVDLRALTLRFEDAASARAWTVDGGRLRLNREGQDLTIGADLAVLSGGAEATTLSANYNSRIGETAATFGVSFNDVAAGDIAAQGPAFAWLGVLQAPISGSVRSGLTEEGRFEPLAATLQIGAGAVQPNPGTRPIPFDGARSYFTYTPEERLLRFDELSVRSKWITGLATGTAVLGIDDATGRLRDLVAQIRLENLSANPADLYDAPVQIAAVDADVRMQLDPFRITLGRALVRDQGQNLQLSGGVVADPEGWRLSLDGRMDALAPDRLLTLWPEAFAQNTRRWLAANLREGEISNIDVALRRAPGEAPQNYLAFDYDRATVKVARSLPPVTEGKGHFSLAEDRLVVSLDAGRMTPPEGGTIAMAGTSFIIPDVTARGDDGTPAVVRLEAHSSITATLSLLNLPPLSAMDKATLPVALADGRAAVSATLAFLMKPRTPPKVQYHAQGMLTSVQSDVLVRNRTITSDRLTLAAENTALSISGAGRIDGVPFDIRFDQPIGPGADPGRLTGTFALSEETLDTFGVALPPGTVSGAGQGEIDVTLARGSPPDFELTSDLTGIRLTVPQVSWTKPANRAGSLRIAGVLGEVPRIDALEVSGPGLSAAGTVSLNPDRSLERLRFDSLQVGNWLDGAVDLVGRGAGRPAQVVLRGGQLDLRRAEFGRSAPTPGAPPMEVALDRLLITDTIALTGMRGRFATAGGLDGAFEAQLNGAAPVQGRVVPQDGRSAVRLVSGDAGAILRAAGLLRQVAGGDMSLVLLPVGTGGAFDGRLNVTGVTIRDAPGIAALLNAISVVGLINELNGDGIYFNDVEATFRLTPNLLTLTEASAVGASMGLSMDGTYRLDTQEMRMQGVISPVYLLNAIGALFTRKGEGLIGFNYSLTGPARAPNVSVNPLSALTPAMFREIFRAPPPELPEVDGVTESALPPTTPEPQRPVARTFEGR